MAQLASYFDFGVSRLMITPTKGSQSGPALFTASVIADSNVARETEFLSLNIGFFSWSTGFFENQAIMLTFNKVGQNAAFLTGSGGYWEAETRQKSTDLIAFRSATRDRQCPNNSSQIGLKTHVEPPNSACRMTTRSGPRASAKESKSFFRTKRYQAKNDLTASQIHRHFRPTHPE
jgi:hypothetical protein